MVSIKFLSKKRKEKTKFDKKVINLLSIVILFLSKKNIITVINDKSKLTETRDLDGKIYNVACKKRYHVINLSIYPSSVF